MRPIFENDSTETWSETFSFTTSEGISNLNSYIFNGDLIENGLTAYSDFYNGYSIIFDQNGKEIWNNGDVFFDKAENFQMLPR